MLFLHFRDLMDNLKVHVKWIGEHLLIETLIYTNDETSDLSGNRVKWASIAGSLMLPEHIFFHRTFKVRKSLMMGFGTGGHGEEKETLGLE